MQLRVPSGDTGAASADDAWGVHELGGRDDGAKPSPSGSLSPSSPSPPSKSNSNNSNRSAAANAAREKPVAVVPCPRCESMNTKFCYYNNYSVTQPRHFCRQCQRYWTAGGTLRNVPVGGGSRKKNRQSRSSEPYAPRNAHGASPLGVASSPTGAQSLMQNVPGHGHFQQMLAQEAGGMQQLGYAQAPAFGFHPFALDPSQGVDLGSAMQQQAMYGAGAPMQAQAVPQYYQLQAPQQQEAAAFHHDAVKSEYWAHPGAAGAAGAPPAKPSPRFESAMLLNLGLDSRGRELQQAQPPQPAPQQQQAQTGSERKDAGWEQADAKPATKKGSPPHGSSTIEEEGSTPTNGYSTPNAHAHHSGTPTNHFGPFKSLRTSQLGPDFF